MEKGALECGKSSVVPGVVVLTVKGRLDGFGSRSFGDALDPALNNPETVAIVLDLRDVSYLSSAGLRVFTMALKRLKERGGILVVCNLHKFCRDILEISGMGSLFTIVDTSDEAIALCLAHAREKEVLDSWADLETIATPLAQIRVIPGDDHAHGAVAILGDVKQVLHADLGENEIASKTFSETEYSIGCGALGDELEDYYPIMGEMITIGGTMVWLPTDGNDTPDFLIPRRASGAVTIRTGFNACVAGGFDEYFLVDSVDPKGIPIDQLYRTIFDSAKKRRANYRGVVGLAGRAEFSEVFGAGIRKSPISRFKPENGETILHPSNINNWFSGDQVPRLRNVTGLLCGIGVDLTSDLSTFDPAHVDRAFYRHPDNTAGKPHLLHNHSVFFTKQSFPETMVNLAGEIQSVVENGDFKDMRHLLDQSRVTKAFLGLSYTQQIRSDSAS
jgi:anti-anti-sigma factor